jgi:glyoxylase-like metal-dependent hydrolase (beta-lactamase superfamily II)
MSSLVEVGEGVWVRTSERFVTNTTVVRLAGASCLVVDPAVDPDDLAELVAALASVSLDVAAGWSTHPHWDHVLWSSGLGADVPRYATAVNARHCRDHRDKVMARLAEASAGHELDLCARLTAVDLDAAGLARFELGLGIGSGIGSGVGSGLTSSAGRCRVIEHSAHARGHGALFFPDLGLFVAGDMASDIEIPLLDSHRVDPVGDYLAALRQYQALIGSVTTFVPGHGAVGDGRELERRIAADRAYLSDLVSGRPSDDPRLATAWLATEHERHLALVRTRALR